MRIITIISVLCTTYVLAFSEEPRLTTSNDSALVHILNNFDIIAEHKDYPTAIRIIRVRDHGECGPSLTNCPKESLYITVSSFDEYPDQKLYVLSKSYGWKFKRWISLPDKNAPDGFAVFEIIEKVISRDKSNKPEWKDIQYEVYVDVNKASIKQAK